MAATTTTLFASALLMAACSPASLPALCGEPRLKLMTEAPFRMERRSTEQKLGLNTEYQRQYPHGPILGNVLGHDSLEAGQREGLERILAQFLVQARRTLSA